jgi:hypothetical protein
MGHKPVEQKMVIELTKYIEFNITYIIRLVTDCLQKYVEQLI